MRRFVGLCYVNFSPLKSMESQEYKCPRFRDDLWDAIWILFCFEIFRFIHWFFHGMFSIIILCLLSVNHSLTSRHRTDMLANCPNTPSNYPSVSPNESCVCDNDLDTSQNIAVVSHNQLETIHNNFVSSSTSSYMSSPIPSKVSSKPVKITDPTMRYNHYLDVWRGSSKLRNCQMHGYSLNLRIIFLQVELRRLLWSVDWKQMDWRS